MNCEEVKKLLSAYFDDELLEEQRSRLSEHIETCNNCMNELAAFEKLSKMTGAFTTPPPPEQIWAEIEEKLHQETDEVNPAPRSTRVSQHRSLPLSKVFAVAATILIVLGVGWYSYLSWFGHGHGHHDEFTVEFGHYLEAFDADPENAQEFLLAKYEHQLIDPTQTNSELGYQPVVAKGLPTGYEVRSTYVMKMPCCTCVQCLHE